MPCLFSVECVLHTVEYVLYMCSLFYIYYNLVLNTRFSRKKRGGKETKAYLLHGVSGVGVEDKEAV
jgi:hypothetical protein